MLIVFITTWPKTFGVILQLSRSYTEVLKADTFERY